MAEGLEDATIAFASEIAPQSRPRDQSGKFVQTRDAPEPMFGPREIEGDPDTGDTRDGGDDQRLRTHEQSVADGRPPPARREPDDQPVEDDEPENIGALEEGEESDGEETPAEQGDKYEITVDGATHEVTLQEALNGYVRQATFHQRMAQVSELQQQLEKQNSALRQGWQVWHKARQDYEEDLANLIPTPPNWDELFAKDPQYAYGQRKIYETLWNKLNQSRQLRAEREQEDQKERDRQTHDYAIKGFTKFVTDNVKWLPDEPTLKKNIQSMRRTAMSVGFSEDEVATVYDPRMLTILLKASKYDRMTAKKPLAVIPGKGKTLTPGASTPLSGNGRRSGIDDAQRQLAKSGKLQDAVEVFRRIL